MSDDTCQKWQVSKWHVTASPHGNDSAHGSEISMKSSPSLQLRVTTNGGNLVFSAISPDGLFLAYSDTNNLRVLHLEGGKSKRLKLPGKFAATRVVFSADRCVDCLHRIIYSKFKNNVIFVQKIEILMNYNDKIWHMSQQNFDRHHFLLRSNHARSTTARWRHDDVISVFRGEGWSRGLVRCRITPEEKFISGLFAK